VYVFCCSIQILCLCCFSALILKNYVQQFNHDKGKVIKNYNFILVKIYFIEMTAEFNSVFSKTESEIIAKDFPLLGRNTKGKLSAKKAEQRKIFKRKEIAFRRLHLFG